MVSLGKNVSRIITMSYISTALTVAYYLASPIIFLLKILLSVLLVIIAPILHLGQYSFYVCWYSLHLLGKFEVIYGPTQYCLVFEVANRNVQTLYIFFGVAIFIGALTGTSLHYITSCMISILHLESQPEEEEGERSLAEYRARKQEIKEKEDPLREVTRKSLTLPKTDAILANDLKNWGWKKEERGRSRNGLIPNTILEEEDSSEQDF